MRKDLQKNLKPFVIGWGFRRIDKTCSVLTDQYEYLGTKDFAPYLAVKKAVQIQRSASWQDSQLRSQELAKMALKKLCSELNAQSLYKNFSQQKLQMFALVLLTNKSAEELDKHLASNSIEAKTAEHNGQLILRVSINDYNSEKDLDILTKIVKGFL